MLNIQSLVVRSSSHSSSFSKWAEGKAYSVKIQFVQMIIQDIDTTGTSKIEFSHRSRRRWCARKQTGLGVTSIDPMCIEESKEDKVEEHHFVEA